MQNTRNMKYRLKEKRTKFSLKFIFYMILKFKKIMNLRIIVERFIKQ